MRITVKQCGGSINSFSVRGPPHLFVFEVLRQWRRCCSAHTTPHTAHYTHSTHRHTQHTHTDIHFKLQWPQCMQNLPKKIAKLGLGRILLFALPRWLCQFPISGQSVNSIYPIGAESQIIVLAHFGLKASVKFYLLHFHCLSCPSTIQRHHCDLFSCPFSKKNLYVLC